MPSSLRPEVYIYYRSTLNNLYVYEFICLREYSDGINPFISARVVQVALKLYYIYITYRSAAREEQIERRHETCMTMWWIFDVLFRRYACGQTDIQTWLSQYFASMPGAGDLRLCKLGWLFQFYCVHATPTRLWCRDGDAQTCSKDNIHCVSKKQDTKLLPITSPNVNWFSKFFHWQIHR